MVFDVFFIKSASHDNKTYPASLFYSELLPQTTVRITILYLKQSSRCLKKIDYHLQLICSKTKHAMRN